MRRINCSGTLDMLSYMASGSSIRATRMRLRLQATYCFYIRAGRLDMCFELAKRIMERIGDSVAINDDDQDFRHFQDRDLIDFVDGIDNP
jgi:hypothetical protein